MAKKATNDDPASDTLTADAAPEAADEAGADKGGKLNMTAVFDEAMQALGRNAKPLKIQEWIQSHYHVTPKTTLLSTYKGNWLRKRRGAAVGKRPVGRPRKVVEGDAPVARVEKDATLNDIRGLKEMIARVGMKQFREMLSLLGVG